MERTLHIFFFVHCNTWTFFILNKSYLPNKFSSKNISNNTVSIEFIFHSNHKLLFKKQSPFTTICSPPLHAIITPAYLLCLLHARQNALLHSSHNCLQLCICSLSVSVKCGRFKMYKHVCIIYLNYKTTIFWVFLFPFVQFSYLSILPKLPMYFICL